MSRRQIAVILILIYDWIVNAIGPFELTGYLGLAFVIGALALTLPLRAPQVQQP